MPDSTRQTLSATQIPALFNRHRTVTLWQLYHWAKSGLSLDQEPDERMLAGKFLQPAIVRMTAAKMRLDVIENDQDTYFRHPEHRIGCTPDGYAIDPQKGLGFIETKNVDFMIFRDAFDELRCPPEIELQHQTQLMIPHPEHGMPQWGIIAVLVGGNSLHLYERDPLPDVQAEILEEAAAFWNQVAAGDEPSPTGDVRDVRSLLEMYPRVEPGNVLDVRGTAEAEDLANHLHELNYWSRQRKQAEKIEDAKKALILARAAPDVAQIRAQGYRASISKYESRKAKTITLPESVKAPLRERLDFLDPREPDDEETKAAIIAALEWHIDVPASLAQRVTLTRYDEEIDETPEILRSEAYA